MEKRDAKTSIGLPRALLYYKYQKFWPVFFEALGFEVKITPQTNKEILTKGCKIAETESCLSFKIYQGHIDHLINKQRPDYIFAPRIISLRKKHLSCPKFFGLPDLVKIQAEYTKIIAPEIDFNKESFQQSILKTGKLLNKSEKEIKQAYTKAYQAEMENWRKKAVSYDNSFKGSQKKIVLISHSYNLYDQFINLNIKKKLEKNQITVIHIDSVPYNFEATFSHWDFAAEMLNQVKTVIKRPINGAIQLSTFNCGCDSVIKEFIADEFKTAKIPYLSMMIDEHSGEAGLLTRIEAFLDTL